MKRIGDQRLTGSIHNLARARFTRRQREAVVLERLAAEVIGPQNAAQLALAFAAQTPDPDASNRWIFAMISPNQNAAVVRWLAAHSKRPQAALRLWAELLTALRPDTGEILLSRQQIADRVGILPRDVSSIMTELVSINAVLRSRDGRRVVYAMNPGVATHIPSPEARRDARKAAGPLLVLMEGGKPDDA